MPDDFPEDFNPYRAPKADMSFPEPSRSGFAVGADAVLRDSPARVPFRRGLRWPAAVWSAAFSRPAYWLPMGCVLALALAGWAWLFAVPLRSDAVFFGVMPLAGACVLGAARRHVLGPAEADPDPVTLWARALLFGLLLAGLVWGLAAFWSRPAGALRQVAARADMDVAFGALSLLCLFAASFVLTFWILLAQALTETLGLSLSRALRRAGQALWRNLPACVLCAATLACAAAAVMLCAAFGLDELRFASEDAKQLFFFLCLLLPLPFFALELLLTPWLMVRDMFYDATPKE